LRTIRGKLIIGVVPGLVLLISSLCAALYFYMVSVLVAQQDSTLNNRARVVESRARWADVHHLKLISPDVDYGEFGRAKSRPSCFEIFNFDGTPLVRSQLLGSSDLPMPSMKDDGPVYFDVTFPNGRPGRAVCLRYAPGANSDVSFPPDPHLASTGEERKLIIILAKDAFPVQDPSRVLLWSLVALVGTMATGIIVLMSLSLRRGLRPLERIARQAAHRSPDDAPELFPTAGMPGELQPICNRLNDLLDRLYTALQRQRRFTTDAAHELRTPIAELRSVAEVAAKWGDLSSTRESLADVLEVTRKMETIVTTLLEMARCDYAKQPINLQKFDVNPMIEKVWRTFEPRAKERGIDMQMDLLPDAAVQSDPVLLESILINLFSNAADYATAGSTLSCTTRLSDQSLELSIANDVVGLNIRDLPHLFEPFWRKESSPADDRHTGLGLTLTKSYAEALNAPLKVEMIGSNRLSFALRLLLVV
jgi:two-component system sensor histidine kinase QseC